MMLQPFKLTAILAAFWMLGVGVSGHTQTQGSSSQSQPTTPPSQNPDTEVPSYGVYVATDPLAQVRYDNRWDLSLGTAYDHMKAGPTLLQGSNLGGLDMDGSFWLTHHWGLEGSGRGYVGTSGAGTSSTSGGGNAVYNIKGPMVKQYFFVGGVEALGPHNKHGAIFAHAMFGGVYGNFQKDLRGEAPGVVDFYYNQIAPAAIVGGHFDLNRSEHWVFRVTPDAIMTHYNFHEPPPSTVSFSRYDVNFAISVGAEYRFTKFKRPTKPGNWVSGW
jgi:hypothetical protein